MYDYYILYRKFARSEVSKPLSLLHMNSKQKNIWQAGASWSAGSFLPNYFNSSEYRNDHLSSQRLYIVKYVLLTSMICKVIIKIAQQAIN